MIDETNLRALTALAELAGGEGYKVIDRAELAMKLPDVASRYIEASMRELHQQGYINIKMMDAEDICLAITEMGYIQLKEHEEIKKLTGKEVLVRKDGNGNTLVAVTGAENGLLPVKNKKFSRLSSFLWGALGGAITSISAILIFVFAI